MKKLFAITCFLFPVFQAIQAQDLEQYDYRKFIQSGDTLPYRVLLPLNYDTARAYPLLIFLHGRGESGNDNKKQLTHGARFFLVDSIRKQYPAIIVFPQCPSNSYWSNVQTVADRNGKRTFYFVPGGEPSLAMELLMSLTDNLFRQYKIRQQQVYVMGLSMGGMGTFELVRRKKGLFTAAVAICGGAHPATAKALKSTSWWIFHGAKDDVVLPDFSREMVQALRSVKARVQYTEYPQANHNSWDPAFGEPGLLNWLFSQHK